MLSRNDKRVTWSGVLGSKRFHQLERQIRCVQTVCYTGCITNSGMRMDLDIVLNQAGREDEATRLDRNYPQGTEQSS